MKTLTKEQIIDLHDNANLADALGLDYVSTTVGTNGYPSNVKYAIVSPGDSINELNETADFLKSLGFEVEFLELHKRDGWGLWNRKNVWRFEQGQYLTASEQDYIYDFDPEKPEAETRNDLIDIFGNDNLFEEISLAKENTRFFLDIENNMIDYSVSHNSAGYSYDTHSYRMALRIDNISKYDDDNS